MVGLAEVVKTGAGSGSNRLEELAVCPTLLGPVIVLTDASECGSGIALSGTS